MNNYYNYQKQNFMNNYDNQNLFTPYEGFIRGNMFRNLYDPYKREEPFQIQPMNEQAKMLTDIDSLGFAITDLNLYLDTNPDDMNAINLFNQYMKQKESLLKTYEGKYGPITLSSDVLGNCPWMWDNKPWPWEN